MTSVRLRPRSEVLLDLGPLTLDVIETTTHVERLLGDMVKLTVRDLGEALDRVGQRDRRTLQPSELLGNVGVLGQETLDTTRPVDQDLILFGELVDAQDRDDVLQLLVALQDRDHPHRRVVVIPVSYTHLRAHETRHDLVCRLLLEKKKK